jgi:hypothetical protein
MNSHRKEVIGGVFEASWPLFSVAVIVAALALAKGRGWWIDVLTWPALQDYVRECSSKADCKVYTNLSIDYSIVSAGAALFLFMNGCSFIRSVLKLDRHLVEQGIEYSFLGQLGIYIRIFALLPTMFWLMKIAFLDAERWPPSTDEWAVILTFAGCAIADFFFLVVLLKQKSRAVWTENREVIGALFYIDIPTVFGVWLIAKYGPTLLQDAETKEMMLRAISGGALLIHVVTSQFILCFLVAEAKLSRIIDAAFQTNEEHIPIGNNSRPAA